MKKIVFTAILVFVCSTFLKVSGQTTQKLVDLCNKVAGEEVTYLKDIYVELDAAGPDGKAPKQQTTLILQKGTEYRFTICDAEGSDGKAMIQLYDMNKLYASTYTAATGQSVNGFNFQCQKTGPYHVFIQSIDGKKITSVAIMSLVRIL